MMIHVPDNILIPPDYPERPETDTCYVCDQEVESSELTDWYVADMSLTIKICPFCLDNFAEDLEDGDIMMMQSF